MNECANNALIWFRQDLRVTDHVALTAACDFARKNGGTVTAIYTATPEQWRSHDVAPIQLDFIERHLNLLAQSLANLGIELKLLHLNRYSQVAEHLAQICQTLAIGAVFAHCEPEYNEIQRDIQVGDKLHRIGVAWHCMQGHCLLAPGSVLNQSGLMFKVFTPFSKVWRRQLLALGITPLCVPAPMSAAIPLPSAITLGCEKRDSSLWRAGEAEAKYLLDEFIVSRLHEYKSLRDYPAIEGTSTLSPYLAIGVLSPRQCLAAALLHEPEALMEGTASVGAYTWVTELCWRDFYRHLLVAFPRLSKARNFNTQADKIVWRNDAHEYERWCRGETGYPIVDAAMRQLNQTGWMHNRLRMIVASFLTKHLLIDWRWGEQYFRRNLIDGDLAANNGGWQWSAGTGCDAQPYFRIFNPLSQSEKFDPEGIFIRKFLPQLTSCSAKQLHTAQVVNNDLFTTSAEYPLPIVEHKSARVRALDTLAAMKRMPASTTT